jgi:hypothetical protein
MVLLVNGTTCSHVIPDSAALSSLINRSASEQGDVLWRADKQRMLTNRSDSESHE